MKNENLSIYVRTTGDQSFYGEDDLGYDYDATESAYIADLTAALESEYPGAYVEVEIGDSPKIHAEIDGETVHRESVDGEMLLAEIEDVVGRIYEEGSFWRFDNVAKAQTLEKALEARHDSFLELRTIEGDDYKIDDNGIAYGRAIDRMRYDLDLSDTSGWVLVARHEHPQLPDDYEILAHGYDAILEFLTPESDD